MAHKTLSERIAAALIKAGMPEIAAESRERLEVFANEVALRSAQMHLVGKGDIIKNVALLLFDSLLLLNVAEHEGILPPIESPREGEGRHSAFLVADIGSGAGFPGVVWKILRPDLDVTLFERKERLHGFLERVILMLSLADTRALATDAAGGVYAGSFHLVVSKAAGRLPALLPLAERLLVSGSPYLTIKGRSWNDELAQAQPSSMSFERAAELPYGRGFALVLRKG